LWAIGDHMYASVFKPIVLGMSRADSQCRLKRIYLTSRAPAIAGPRFVPGFCGSGAMPFSLSLSARAWTAKRAGATGIHALRAADADADADAANPAYRHPGGGGGRRGAAA
jgi:hypothetical protein